MECKACNGKMVEVIKNHFNCAHCGKFYKWDGKDLVPGGEADIYEKAMSLIPDLGHRDDYAALRLFEMLGSYSNSVFMAEKLRSNINKAELNEEIVETKRKDRIQLLKMIAAIGAVILVIVLIVNSIKKSIYEKNLAIYNECVAIYDAGDYEGAIQGFKKIKKFSNSEEYIKQANALIEERSIIYKKGIDYYEAELYSKALEEFGKIPVSYEKKDVYIEQCAAQLYDKAETLYKQDNLDDAKVILNDFPSNTESSIKAEGLLDKIDTELELRRKASEYDTAVKLFEEGNYSAAQKGFMSLGNYESTSTYKYLTDIGRVFYDEAMTAYNEGNYIGCAEVIGYIDSEEEWASYNMSLELLEKAKTAYRAPIEEEARRVCRVSGYSAMSSYIDGMICSLLDQSAAGNMKKLCEVKRVEMRTLTPFLQGTFGLGYEETAEDNFGGRWGFSYEGYMDIEDGGAWEVFYLGDDNFQTLTATVAVQMPWSSIGESRVGVIRIYGDDKLLFADTNITARCRPYPIEVNIAGIEELKIECYGDGNMGNTGIHVLLCEPMLIE